MKNLNIYLQESLLDDFDDLDAKSEEAIVSVVSDELSKLMSIMAPLYKRNFETGFHKFYDSKTNIFNANIMANVCLYITKYNNNIYAIPCNALFISRHTMDQEDFKENFSKLIEIIDSFNIKFSIPRHIEWVYIMDEIKSGKIHNITLGNILEINTLSMSTFSEDTMKWLNNITKELNVLNVQYRNGVFDLNTDFIFPFSHVNSMSIKLPVKIGNKILPYKTGAGLTNNDKAHEFILNFLKINYAKNRLFSIKIFKTGSAFMDGQIILNANRDGSYSAVYNKIY